MAILRPVAPERTTQEVADLYRNIQDTFGLPTVPIMFQYIANFPAYLTYLWEHLERNIVSSSFSDALVQAEDFSELAISIIYQPSPETANFLEKRTDAEKKELMQVTKSLLYANTRLYLLTIAIRESIKGAISQIQLPKRILHEEEHFVHETAIVASDNQSEDIQSMQRMLAPLFGSQSLLVVSYPDFFSVIAHDMEVLMTTEAYLKTRVELEHLAMDLIKGFPYPLQTSFHELMSFADGEIAKMYELLYILKDVYPIQYPRLLLTSYVMKNALEKRLDIVPY